MKTDTFGQQTVMQIRRRSTLPGFHIALFAELPQPERTKGCTNHDAIIPLVYHEAVRCVQSRRPRDERPRYGREVPPAT